MGRLLLGRALALVPMLLMVSAFVFLLVRATDTDPVRQVLGDGASDAQRAELRHALGYDRPLAVQFWTWLGAAVRGDLGRSLFTDRAVLASFGERLPATLGLVAGGLLVAVAAGLPAGILAALRAGSAVDRAVTGLASLALATPGFWLALLLVLAFGVRLRWFPVVGYTPFSDDPAAWARGLVLPGVALGAPSAAVIARQARGALAETLRATYVRALRATGTSRRRIVTGYALRNAMPPVLTVIGWELSTLIAVSFVIERVFGVPGIGTLLLDGVVRNDIPVVQGGVVLVACVVVLVNLAVDVGYGLLDPKVRPR
ncbi:ABC transporter permease [Actinomadura syzygii]|uniref:ABC transporter permease n=1 Tax=Actinomadura syzygii TaxID=1427538 RepID=A0A5D0UKB1_9ACTN|nr:ABC transporter permease [Actinomadura syzygii]TYC17579.1 ABC transporter permease [Actinomadura syzygii]